MCVIGTGIAFVIDDKLMAGYQSASVVIVVARISSIDRDST
jgi:hypothetical protein